MGDFMANIWPLKSHPNIKVVRLARVASNKRYLTTFMTTNLLRGQIATLRGRRELLDLKSSRRPRKVP
jgi:hypothetical protein